MADEKNGNAKDQESSIYAEDARGIRLKYGVRGAKAVIIMVLGEPAANGFCFDAEPEVYIEVRAGLPDLLEDLAKKVRAGNRSAFRPAAPSVN